MLIDCDACIMQHTEACRDCVVTLLLEGVGQAPVQLDRSQRIALGNLAEAGMVPALRLIPRPDEPHVATG